MANIAECGIRIAVNDLPKVAQIIRKAPKGAESCYIIEVHYSPAFEKPVKYKCVLKNEFFAGGPKPDHIAEAWELVNFETQEWKKIDVSEMPTKEVELPNGKKEQRLDVWYTNSTILKWEEVFTTTSGEEWVLDLTAVHKLTNAWPSITEIMWAELGTETLEVLFSSKWDFPVELSDALTKLAYNEDGEVVVHWQGAISEPGMGCVADDLGTEDLGLCINYEAICPECYDTIEEQVADGKNAEDYTCPTCKDAKGEPARCFGQSYVGAYITNDGKQWRKK